MKKYMIEWVQMIGKEPETFMVTRKSAKTAQTFYNKLKADPSVTSVNAYDLTPATFGK